MPRYIIERNLPGAGTYSEKEIKSLARQNCSVLHDMGTQIQWIESFVTENKLYCIYLAPDKSVLMRHASLWNLPANRIEAVKVVIDPVTAEDFPAA